MLTLRIIYLLNIFVAGSIAYSAIRDPARAAATTFQNAYPPNESIRLVGCLWLAVTVLSILGLFRPLTFAPVLLFQIIYKGSWLLFVAYPALRAGEAFPRSMAWFFVIWVLVLPLAIPWKIWWGSAS